MIHFYKPAFFLCVLLSACLFSYSQEVTLSIKISNTFNAAVSDATISVNQKKYKADSLGDAVIRVPRGNNTIQLSSVNHYPYASNVNLTSDTTIRVVMRLRESLL